MNTKTSKQHPGVGKSKLNNGEAEVFVLPPNLLEKLGIKLDNIECTVKGPNDDQNIEMNFENEGCVQENKVEDATSTSDTQITHFEKESSILETASLMKKSVFLSPTFVPTIANVIPDEVEILSTSKKSEGIKDQTECSNRNTELEVSDYNLSEKHENNQKLIKFNDVEQQSENNIQENNKEIIRESYKVLKETKLTTNIKKDKPITSILLSAKEKQNKPKNKINIVSEQIVSLPKLSQSHKLNLVPKKGLIPVTVNTIITPKNCHGLDSKNKIFEQFPHLMSTTDLDSKYFDNICQIGQNISKDQIDAQTDKIKSVLDQITEEINISNDLSSSVIFTNNVNESRGITGSTNIIALSKSQITNGVDIFSEEGELMNTDNIVTFYSANNEIINNNVDMSLNNNTIEDFNCDLSNRQTSDYNGTSNFEIGFVNDFDNIERNYIPDEIIQYGNSLDRAIDETPNSITDLSFIMMCKENISNDKYLENQSFENSTSYACLKDNEYLLVNSGNGLIKSKSCIQGVEKPGGELDKKESKQKPIALKTYVKKKTSKSNINLDLDYQLDLVHKTYKCVDYEIDPTKLDTTCKTHNYCMCEDFGKLTYYDNNDAYEHIHFWRTESVSCEPNLVFDMYSDINKVQDYIVENREEISFLEKRTSKICWNGIFDFENFDRRQISLLTETANSTMTHLENIQFNEIKTNHDIENNKLIAAGNINSSDLVAEINQPTLFSLKNANMEESVLVTKIIPPEHSILDQSKMEIKPESNCLAHKEVSSYTNAIVEESQNKQDLMKNAEVKVQANTSDGNSNITENYLLNLPAVSEVIQPLMGVIHTIKIERVDTTNHIKTNSKNENDSNDIVSSKIKCSSQVTNTVPNKTELPVEQEDNILFRTAQSDDFLPQPQRITENLLRDSKINNKIQICTYATKGKGKKRRKSDRESEKLSELSEQPCKKDLKCSICNQMLAEVDWERHISEEHDYLTWKSGNTIVPSKLSDSMNTSFTSDIEKTLESSLLQVKEPKHDLRKDSKDSIEKVSDKLSQPADMVTCKDVKSNGNISSTIDDHVVKCGVCHKDIANSAWTEHIMKEHNYLAWKDGEPRLNLEDEEEKYQYLFALVKKVGRLVCGKCGFKRKYARLYLDHINKCDGKVLSKEDNSANTSVASDADKTLDASQLQVEEPRNAIEDSGNAPTEEVDVVLSKEHNSINTIVASDKTLDASQLQLKEPGNAIEGSGNAPTQEVEAVPSIQVESKNENLSRDAANLKVKCGVCQKDMKPASWNKHIMKEHNYLAWKEGEPSLDLEDEEEKYQYLFALVKEVGRLVCGKCGLKRKYARLYLDHINKCDGKVLSKEDNSANTSVASDADKTLDASQLQVEEPRNAIEDSGNAPTEEVDMVLSKEHNSINTIVASDKTLDARQLQLKEPRNAIEDSGNAPTEEVDMVLSKEHNSINTIVASDKTLEASQLQLKEPGNAIEGSGNAPTQEVEAVPSIQVESKNENLSRDAANLKVKCGVCQKDMKPASWNKHIMKEHNYLAWKEGEPSLDLEDEEEKYQYLFALVKEVGRLVCGKCGLKRKYARLYLDHINKCDGTVLSKDDNSVNASVASDAGKTLDTSQLHLPEPRNPIEDTGNAPTQEVDVISSIQAESEKVNLSCDAANTETKCGVCQKDMKLTRWSEHIMKEHNYLAWKEGEPSLDLKDEEKKYEYLYALVKKLGCLVCGKCGFKRKYARNYLDHINTCDGTVLSKEDNSVNTSVTSDADKTLDASQLQVKRPRNAIKYSGNALNQEVDMISSIQVQSEQENLFGDDANTEIKCGVCQIDMKLASWSEHIMKEHNYLAWKEGEPSLNLEDEEEKYQYLYALVKKVGCLVCGKCGFKRKYARNYLDHINKCDGTAPSKVNDPNTSLASDIDQTLNSSQLESKNSSVDTDQRRSHKTAVTIDEISSIKVQSEEENLFGDDANTVVKCGVCQKDMKLATWSEHIMKEHNYLAWKEGEPSLNLEDEEEKYQYLYALVKKVGCLVCGKCGFKRKYARNYLDHINKCDGTAPSKVNDPNTSLASDIDQTLNSSQLESKNSSVDTDQRRSHKTAATIDEISSIQVQSEEENLFGEDANTVVKCGVCQKDLKLATWSEHIMEEHNYLAWKEGEPRLNLEDEEEKYQYLYALVKKVGCLVCGKCGFKRKYARNYLDHINKCDGTALSKVNVPNTSLASDIDQTLNSSQLESKNSSVDTDQRRSHKTAVTIDENPTDQVVDMNSIVKCGVCQSDVINAHWITHLKQHNYLAWKEGELSLNLNDDKQVRNHLYTLLVQYESLMCSKCGLQRKQVKRYLDHIKTCDGTSTSNSLNVSGISDVNSTLDSSQIEIHIKNEAVERDVSSRKRKRTKVNYEESEEQTVEIKKIKKEPLASSEVKESLPNSESVKCGVCNDTVDRSHWYHHIEIEYNYMAWKEGEPALDLDDEEEVWHHLNDISKKLGGLVCSKCSYKRKYVKVFLEHINNCDGTIEVPIEYNKADPFAWDMKLRGDVKCGVCSKVIQNNKWLTHIQVSHNYMAWMDGEEQLNVNDSDTVRAHLGNILRYVHELKCVKCGFSRRNAKAYMVHMETCSFDSSVTILEDKNELLRKNNGRYECAVCHQLIEPKKWREHAMNEHYNIAWVVGDPPIDLISPYGTDKYLKEYWKKFGKLICKVCGERRSSCMGFYVHIITCGKSDEETEMYKNTCEICGNKYLTIYKSQHMTAHKEAEYVKECRKLAQETRKKLVENDSDDEPLGRRKAAEKAQTVIEDYKTNLKQEVYAHNCSTCGFASDSKKRFDSHICKEQAHESNSEDSINESEDVDDSESDASFSETEECNEEIVREIAPVPRKSSWLPFKVIGPKTYIQAAAEQFCATHFTNETLFPQWRTCKYNKVSEEQVGEYLPKVQQSCKVKLNKEWRTLNQFEAIKIYRAFSFFTGGSTQCIAWAPLLPNDEQEIGGNYLAVSCHQTGNSPRFNYDEIHSHVGLIQIWHFADFKIEHPKLVLGVAHEYGTVWDIAWCPSGARDKYAYYSKDKTWARIGLLAAACSNGNVYIFSVPYPASIEDTDKLLVLKLKPVAELRLKTKSERKDFQATAISWSKKKGHAIIVVGYSDGTFAYYDVTNDSPLVQTVEDEVTIFYPYLDERLLNACVSDVDTMPANGLKEVAICGTSCTGALSAAAPRGPRVTSHIPAAVSLFAPCWPVTLYAGQDAIINQTPNEMDWSGTGRRMGNLQNCCACVMCGRVVLYNPPVLRSMRLFPPSIDLKKKALGLIDMIPLGKKRKLRNDEYATRMEPITYEETIDKYGLEFVLSGQNDRPMFASKDSLPERYPLADVTAMAFCPSRVHHNNLALATHSGVVFVILNA